MNSLEPGTEDFSGGGAGGDQATVSFALCVRMCAIRQFQTSLVSFEQKAESRKHTAVSHRSDEQP